MIIKVTIGSNMKKADEVLEDSTTLRQAFEKAGIDYSLGVSNLDGAALQAGDIDKTFADFEVSDHCFLTSVVKADNGA